MTSETINSVVYQPFVKVERLSEALYQEFITKGCVKVKEDKSILNPNPRPFENKAAVMTKFKETVLKKCPNFKDGNVKIILVPQKIFKDKFQNSSGSSIPLTPFNKSGAKLIFPPSKIVRYGVEDLKRDELKRKEEIREKMWKQKVLRKMLDKYHEKETKKEVLYRQKRLTKFVLRYKEVVDPYTDFLICARKLVKGRKDGKIVLKELENIKNAKIRKYVKMFFKDLLYALEEVPVVVKKLPCDQQSEATIGEEKADESNLADFRKKAFCNLVLDAVDPFVNAGLITDDQQLLECICGKPNCLVVTEEKQSAFVENNYVGLHPEKF